MATQTPTFASANYQKSLAYLPIRNQASAIYQKEVAFVNPISLLWVSAKQQNEKASTAIISTKSSQSKYLSVFAGANFQKELKFAFPNFSFYASSVSLKSLAFPAPTINRLPTLVTSQKYSPTFGVTLFQKELKFGNTNFNSQSSSVFQKQKGFQYINFQSSSVFQKPKAFQYPTSLLWANAKYQKLNAVGNVLIYRQMTTSVVVATTNIVSDQFQS